MNKIAFMKKILIKCFNFYIIKFKRIKNIFGTILLIISLFVLIHLIWHNTACDGQNKEDKEYSFFETEKCETIHVGIVCVGASSNVYFYTLLKSIYFFRTNPLHFHIITNNVSAMILSRLFETWTVPRVTTNFYNLNKFLSEISWVQTQHYSGVYGLLKLTFPKVVPNNVSKIIILDIDLTLNGDIAELWHLFRNFNYKQSIGLVENESDFYLYKNVTRWPAIGKGYNTGVILYNLDQIRSIGWDHVWYKVGKSASSIYGTASLADQDIINAVIKNYPEILFRISCAWNIQLSEKTLSFNCYRNNTPKIVHWNSSKKINFLSKNYEYFKNMYSIFSELNGNLLEKSLCYCLKTPTEEKEISKDVCNDFRRNSDMHWRTLLFIKHFEYLPLTHDVTFVAQLSYDRIYMLEELFNTWEGPISLTLYITDSELQEIGSYLNTMSILKRRSNVAFHVVFKKGKYYPINHLRNNGLEQIITPYVFLADIDFAPMPNLYFLLKQYTSKMHMDKKALTVPAFETQKYKNVIPKNKTDLLNMLEDKQIFTFRYDTWTSGHAPTNYSWWTLSNEPYRVQWKIDFEPYVVVKTNIPRYDTRFMGFGWNKVSHIMDLAAQGYEFVVLPDVFIVHRPHGPSYDVQRFRKSAIYRRCLEKLKQDFVSELQVKYYRTIYKLGESYN